MSRGCWPSPDRRPSPPAPGLDRACLPPYRCRASVPRPVLSSGADQSRCPSWRGCRCTLRGRERSGEGGADRSGLDGCAAAVTSAAAPIGQDWRPILGRPARKPGGGGRPPLRATCRRSGMPRSKAGATPGRPVSDSGGGDSGRGDSGVDAADRDGSLPRPSPPSLRLSGGCPCRSAACSLRQDGADLCHCGNRPGRIAACAAIRFSERLRAQRCAA